MSSSGKWRVYIKHMVQDSVRGETIYRNDSRTWCNRCDSNQYEDLIHMLWNCLELQAVWEWVRNTIIAAAGLSTNFQFTPAQALLGTKVVNGGARFPLRLWEVLQGHAVWEIWKSKLKCGYDHIIQPLQTTIVLIWSKICQYMKIGWHSFL
jgi:hypothetical protein